MAVTNAMYIFEVVVQSVNSMIPTKDLVIRSDFADVFSLELKDPKQMHIVIPEPPPLPPEPPGKKKKAKPKPKKGKKGKKGEVEAPPPEPVIQAGQSVLFTSSAELLTQNMKKFPLEISLWNKEDNLVYIGSTSIPWDPIFFKYLEALYNCKDTPPVTLNEEYNIFEEGTAKLIVKVGIQVKLSYLGEKVTSSFRTLSEDPIIKKVLYTGMNSKTTSYMCTMKTTDEVFEENSNKVENNYIIDKPKKTNMVYADYKNAPIAQFNIFNEGDYCCMNNADKPPSDIYKAPEKCPDIDFIIEYVRKIISSCYDNMRMLTPRPTIRPRIKATDIDRLCYCQESKWPDSEISQRFKKEVQKEPCPLCIVRPGEKQDQQSTNVTTFDIANIRGPCGRHDCKIARHIRAYIENLVEEDKKEINLDDIIGLCGSKDCTLVETIREFLRREGIFNETNTLEGLSTQCACIQQLQKSLKKTKSDDTSSTSSENPSLSESSDSKKSYCRKKGCPFGESAKPKQVYNVFYCFVQFDQDNKSGKSSPSEDNKTPKYQYCSSECPSGRASEKTYCSKSVCSFPLNPKDDKTSSNQLSPADSNVVIQFDDIHNPCCVKSCNVIETVKDFIVQGVNSKRRLSDSEDPCFCDCDCTFKFSNKTTYCAVCGGYECLGDDLNEIPKQMKPYPCPIYHKQYDKKYIKTKSPWTDEEPVPLNEKDNVSVKSSRTAGSDRKSTRSVKSIHEKRLPVEKSANKVTSAQKVKKPSKDKSRPIISKVEKIGNHRLHVRDAPEVGASSESELTSCTSPLSVLEVDNVGVRLAIYEGRVEGMDEDNEIVSSPDDSIIASTVADKIPEPKYPYPAVPRNMGWLWTAEDVPGLKFRPKWKPGAANKILVRRYKAIREGVDIIAKKKRALLQRKKKLEMKPTLVVKKKNGEYTVQMEVFKKYSKERLIFQYPYDEKPPLIYTIGKTEEEKAKIQRQRERRERRETRRKCRLLQSTFRNKCQEICLKAYNQAIGLLPLPDPNKPECPCYTESVKNQTPTIDSCSCSEDEKISSSDTDNDDWIIEFTPPQARWDPKAKHPPVIADNECQYNYLDFKVKVLDKSGNPVPRFFKGPDGKQECSDLGGFWGPNKIWLEINKDGYIGPDNRWVPMNFTGPDDMFYSAEEGVFTDNTGRTLKIGVDGYIDKDGKWAWYSTKKLPKSAKSKTLSSSATGDTKRTKPMKPQLKENSQGDFKSTSKIKDKNAQKKSNFNIKSACGKGSKVAFSTSKTNNPLIMSVSVGQCHDRKQETLMQIHDMDQNKLNKYNEIMNQIYDNDIRLQWLHKDSRASNTGRKKFTPFTSRKNYEKWSSDKSTLNGGHASPRIEIL